MRILVVKTQDVMDLTERDGHEFQALLDDFSRLDGRTSSPQFVLLDAAEKIIEAEMFDPYDALEAKLLLREIVEERHDLGGGVVM